MSYPQTAVLSCPSCGTTFSYLLSSSAPPRCPACSSVYVSPRTPGTNAAAAAPISPLPSASSPPLSPTALDRQLEARLHSLTTSDTPVAVYLPTPTHAQLQRRLHRLLSSPSSSSSSSSHAAADDGQLEQRLAQLSAGAAGEELTDAELERRMRRLQGEDDSVQAAAAAGREERKNGIAAVSGVAAVSDGDEVEQLLKSMQEDVKLDLQQVQRIGSLLAKPLLSSSSSSSARHSAQDAAMDDPHRLMAHLQSLPSTELAKLRQQRGRRRRRRSAKARAAEDSEEEESSTEEEQQEDEDANDVNDIVMQAMEEAKQA